MLLTETIKAEAKRLGFFASGVAKAGAVDEETARKVRQWLAKGGNADMAYMENHEEKRLDPRLLMNRLKSIVCVALNYAPAQRLPTSEYQLANYALGQDYHGIVKQKLHALAAAIGAENYRAFCDSAPVLERYWAVKAGLGWVGKNHQLIIPNAGSMFFLGELFLDVELVYDTPMKSRCGNCCKCMDACPTQALGTLHFDASKCISYQTIENRGDIPHSIAEKMGNTIYGCDRCQQACPWNRFSTPTDEELLKPKEELLQMTREKWESLSEEDYRRLFKGSAVKRVRYSGLMRNIKAASQQENGLMKNITATSLQEELQNVTIRTGK